MKLQTIDYNSENQNWMAIENIPSNSRYILVYSPEFGTSIGRYIRFQETGSMWEDSLRKGEKVNITHWKELPRYYDN